MSQQTMDRFTKKLIAPSHNFKPWRSMDSKIENGSGDKKDLKTEFVNYDSSPNGEVAVKIICIGDSAVGKSKLLERFLVDSFKPQISSTYALTLYRYDTKIKNEAVIVDFWDTAGQERFNELHASYYHQAHACIMVFDATRKITYKNLPRWLNEMRSYRPEIPALCAANKIDVNPDVTTRPFAFTEKNNLPLYYVSASDGTNVVKLFRDAIAAAVKYKKDPTDWRDTLLTQMDRLSFSPTKKSNDDDKTCPK